MRPLRLVRVSAAFSAGALCLAGAIIHAHTSQTNGIFVVKSVFHEAKARASRSRTKDALFAIAVINYGDKPTVSGQLEITEQLPDNVILNNIDYDGAGPATSNYLLQAGDSGLTPDKIEVKFGYGAGASFTGKIKAGPDHNIRRLQITPKAALKPGSRITLVFRVLTSD